jgi:hypothetical protein
MMIAPITRLIMSQAMMTKPSTARSTEGWESFPRPTGAPGTPSTTTPVSVQPDEDQKQPDPHGKTVFEGEGKHFGKPSPHLGHGEHRKEDPREEDRAQRGLPGVAKDFDHGKGDEGIFAHVGSDGKRTLGIDAHDQGAEGADKAVAVIDGPLGMPAASRMAGFTTMM